MMIEGSISSLLADATVCCLERGEDGNPESIEEVGRQPLDMDGNIPRKCRPIRGVRPEMLNITYFANADCSEKTSG